MKLRMLPPLIAVEKSSGGLSTGFNAIKDPLAISMATFKRRRIELVQKGLAFQSKSDDRWQLSSKYVERLAKPGKWQ